MYIVICEQSQCPNTYTRCSHISVCSFFLQSYEEEKASSQSNPLIVCTSLWYFQLFLWLRRCNAVWRTLLQKHTFIHKIHGCPSHHYVWFATNLIKQTVNQSWWFHWEVIELHFIRDTADRIMKFSCAMMSWKTIVFWLIWRNGLKHGVM